VPGEAKYCIRLYSRQNISARRRKVLRLYGDAGKFKILWWLFNDLKKYFNFTEIISLIDCKQMRYCKFLLPILILACKFSFAQESGLINSGELIKQAAALYDSAKYKEGLKLLDKVSRSDTNYVWSLYERSIDLEADSQFTRAIACCREALALKDQREYEPELYNTYGNTLMDLGKFDEAIHVFDQGMAKYPAYVLFYFNKGVVYMALKHYSDAEQWFQKALLVNPYMYSAHYQLGLAALQQGKIVPAYLSFVGYLTCVPEGKYVSKTINLLDKISKSTDDILDLKNSRTINPDANYQAVEDILTSKIALDKAYKPKVSIDDPISRQIQAVFEKLEYKDADTDFYIQYYLPFYKQVYAENKLEPFIFHIFAGVNIPVIQEYGKKNKKELQAFVEEAATYFNLLRATRELYYKKRATVPEIYLYEDGTLEGKGALSANGKLLVGNWKAFYPPGNLKGQGMYNASGEKEGAWVYYFNNGAVKSNIHYLNGKQDGGQIFYRENGNLSSRESYVNNKADGVITSYTFAGKISFVNNYKQDKKEGLQKEYYTNGSLLSEKSVINDQLSGPSKEYFKSGQLKNVEMFANGKGEGSYKSYFENGQLEMEGQYTKGNGLGEWKYYYESGKLKETRTYVNDKEDGLHQEYYENGQLSATYQTKKDKIDGEADYFYKDGKPMEKYIYQDGVLKSGKFIDVQGHETDIVQPKDGGAEFYSYLDGIKRSAVFSDAKGNFNGNDTLFYLSGKIEEINTYKDGRLNGLSTSWYRNGVRKSETNLTDGREDGYVKSYYINGKLETEGWSRDGDYEGEWLFYDELGRLTEKCNYIDGSMNGYKEFYNPNGKITREEKYHRGWLQQLVQFDTLRNVIKVDSFPKESGAYTLIYPGGKLKTQANYVNGEFDGWYKSFYIDGSPESTSFYKNGMLDSVHVKYYYGGQKSEEGVYSNGKQTGTWKYYDEDGHIYLSEQYSNDQLNGPKIYYLEDGTKTYVSNYRYDEANGTGERLEPDGSTAYRVMFEDGNAQSYTYVGKDGKLVSPIALLPGGTTLKAFFADGKPARECVYSDGLKNGADVVYFNNGQLQYRDSTIYGVSFGVTKEYFPNGKIRSVYNYINDNTTGVCKDYDQNGVLRRELKYDDGVREGPSKYYDKNGKLAKTLWYYYGELISVKNE
jgi:antitoxin component YwqK of YwqJK toxin-antitoxin module/Tfp pilus assembly protein PilF